MTKYLNLKRSLGTRTSLSRLKLTLRVDSGRVAELAAVGKLATLGKIEVTVVTIITVIAENGTTPTMVSGITALTTRAGTEAATGAAKMIPTARGMAVVLSMRTWAYGELLEHEIGQPKSRSNFHHGKLYTASEEEIRLLQHI